MSSLEAAADRLEAILLRLKEAFAPADAAFVWVGDRLGAAASILGRLRQSFGALSEQLQNERIASASGDLSVVATEVRCIAAALTEERATLDRLVSLNDGVIRRIGNFDRTVGAIGVLAMNGRIAAAHIDAPHEDFSVFTSETGRLAHETSATIARFAADHARVVEQLNRTRGNHEVFTRRHHATLIAIGDRLETSLGSLTAHRRQAASVAGKIGAHAKQIEDAVAAAVMAMQIGDITRQRIEHVVEALDVLVTGIGDGGRSGWALSAGEERQRNVVSIVCRLQSSQLGQARADFDEEARRINAALGSLISDARDIVGLGAAHFGSSGQGGESFLAMLARELREADDLLDACRSARAEVDQVASETLDALRELLRQVKAVENIEVDMRLVGLNTSLKCGRLGARGRALTVIAQELRGYANLTVVDAQAIIEALTEIAEMAKALGNTQGEAATSSSLAPDTGGAIGVIENAGRQLTDALVDLEQDGSRLDDLLGNSRIAAHEALGLVLDEITADLDSLSSLGSASGAEDMNFVREHVLGGVARHYTMASEREIHDLIVGGNLASQAAPQAAASVDDFLF